MNEQSLHNEIQREQQVRIAVVLESLMIMIFAFLTAAVLPQLLFQYFISTGQLDANNAFFEHFTLIIYVAALGAVVWAGVSNFMRAKRVRQLQSDLQLLQYVGSDVVETEESTEALALALESSDTKPARKSRKAATSSRASRSSKSSKGAARSARRTK